MFRQTLRSLLSCSFSLLLLLPSLGQAEVNGPPMQKALPEEVSAGVGHFARARSLLIAAINEFDEGLKVVNPDALLDVAKFRASLLDRTQELERVLDPQPKVSRGGVTYRPDSRLIGQKSKSGGAIKK